MSPLPQEQNALPKGLVRDDRPPFVPRMVMAPQLTKLIKHVVAQWRHRDKFAALLKYGIRPLDRLLFYGPPGNGKTLTCYWIAKELGIPVYRVLCDQLRSCYMGDTTKAVGAVLAHLNASTDPAICLWDEAESIFVNRSVSDSSGDREIAAALTVFMQALDRWQAPTLMVLATNLHGQLDSALLSRISLQIEFGGPSADQCEQLLQYWSELLHNYGSDEWGPPLLGRIRQTSPGSFRELQQQIAWCARDWVAARCS